MLELVIEMMDEDMINNDIVSVIGEFLSYSKLCYLRGVCSSWYGIFSGIIDNKEGFDVIEELGFGITLLSSGIVGNMSELGPDNGGRFKIVIDREIFEKVKIIYKQPKKGFYNTTVIPIMTSDGKCLKFKVFASKTNRTK